MRRPTSSGVGSDGCAPGRWVVAAPTLTAQRVASTIQSAHQAVGERAAERITRCRGVDRAHNGSGHMGRLAVEHHEGTLGAEGDDHRRARQTDCEFGGSGSVDGAVVAGDGGEFRLVGHEHVDVGEQRHREGFRRSRRRVEDHGAAGSGGGSGNGVERHLELQKGDGGGIEDGAAASMSARATRPFAPGLTTIALSPSAPTEINATPLGTSAVVRR